MCGSQLSQKTVGIVGMGRIGEAVATRLRAFGVSRIVYSGRNKRPVHGDFVSLDELLTVSDFVIVCCALTKETRHLFNYEAFSKMKKTAVSNHFNMYLADILGLCQFGSWWYCRSRRTWYVVKPFVWRFLTCH